MPTMLVSWCNAYMVYIRICLIFYNILNSALLFEVSLSCLCEGNAYSIHPHTYFCMYCLLFQVQLIFFSSPDPQNPHQFSRTQDKIRVLQPCKVILECGLHSCAVSPLYCSRQHVAGSIYIFQEMLFTTCVICRGIPAWCECWEYSYNCCLERPVLSHLFLTFSIWSVSNLVSRDIKCM